MGSGWLNSILIFTEDRLINTNFDYLVKILYDLDDFKEDDLRL